MGRMIRRFKMDGNSDSIESIVEIDDPEIVYEIIKGIFYGIARGLEEVELFEIEKNQEQQIFSIPRKKWIKALNKCLENMIELEDYETCSEIKKALSILNRNI